MQETNCERPVAYYSCKLNDAKKRYSTMDHEMLTIVDCLRHFKHMLLGRNFTMYMDHEQLVIYFSKAKALSPQEARW